jgi:glycosyltransferase involved in cell wall biosynthesis
MPPITALLHTANDALRLGRALETVLPCQEILVVDHGSSDATKRVALRYGARFVGADRRAASDYAQLATLDWILCLHPAESLTEALQATLFEWSSSPGTEISTSAFNISVREKIGELCRQRPAPETRLIRRSWGSWNGLFPAFDRSLPVLEGDLLRIA